MNKSSYLLNIFNVLGGTVLQQANEIDTTIVELGFKLSCLTQASKLLTRWYSICFNGDDLTRKIIYIKVSNNCSYN